MNVNLDSEKAIYHSTTHRYLLAVLIIALLSTAAYYTLQSALSDSDATAYVVNLSGRQRMLSQHIALDAHRFYDTKLINMEPSSELLMLMTKNINDMGTANRQLSTGILSQTKTVDLSTPIRELYFGGINLYNRVNTYLEVAKKLRDSTDKSELRTYLERIDNTSEQLLKDLNTVVSQYQREGEDRLKAIEKLELFVWIATLIALILEVLFIFRPMVAQLVSSQKVQLHTLENLEEMVELRTLKLEIANKKLKELATQDPLTKLKNRLTLESDVEALIQASERNHVPFAFCMIDIDWFKKVNDTYGHPAGDEVLQEIAKLLKDETREYDHIYRAGGEEFVLILNRIRYDDAISMLEQLRQKVQEHRFNYSGQSIPLTISIGLYHSSQFNFPRVQDILRAADCALYIAKNNGRNCIHAVQHKDINNMTME